MLDELPEPDTRETIRISGGYMEKVLNPESLITMAREHLSSVDFDTVVGRGLSGSMAAPVIAMALGKKYFVLRKRGDGSHSGAPAEGYLGRRWIFVDDFIATGDTRHKVIEQVQEIARVHRFDTAHVGDFLYNGGGFQPVYSPRFFDPESPDKIYGAAAAEERWRRQQEEIYRLEDFLIPPPPTTNERQ